MRKLTVFVRDQSGAKVPNYRVIIHPKMRPQKHLASQSTNADGRADLTFDLNPKVKALTVRVFAPGRDVAAASDTRAVNAVSDHWPIELPLTLKPADDDTPQPPKEPTPDPSTEPSTEPSSGPAPNAQRGPRLTLDEAAKQTLRHRQEVNKALQDTLKDQLLRRRQQRAKKRDFVRDLVFDRLRPSKEPGGRLYVRPDQDAAPAMQEGIERGLDRLGKLDLPGPSLHLPLGQMDALGLQQKDTWQPLSPEAWEGLRGNLDDTGGGKRFERVLEQCRKRTLAKETEASLRDALGQAALDGDGDGGSDGGGDGDREDPASSDAAARSLVDATNEPSLDDIYRALCADLMARLTTGSRPGHDEIAESVKQSITAGPADTAAYYDFHHVTIAWEDVWTSVYDEASVRDVGKLYDELVETVGPDVAAEIENTEYRELTDFVEELQQTLSDAHGLPGRSAPAHLKGWIEGLEEAWAYLPEEDQAYLQFLHAVYTEPGRLKYREFPDWMQDTIPSTKDLNEDYGDANGSKDVLGANFGKVKERAAWALDTAQGIIADVDPEATPEDQTLPPVLGRLGRMLQGIHDRLYREPYEFDVFAPGSYNFGIVHTYQQKWTPLNYQVGDLVSTMPLAPGEKKTYSVKRVVKDTLDTKSSRTSSQTNSSGRSSLARSQADIVAKASYDAATSSTVGGKFGVNIGMLKGNVSGSGTVSANAAQQSSTTKQNIREATLNAAQEFKDERSLEVNASGETSEETTITSEISNLNNEITVTYLFYELQRRFEVSSRLDKLTPTVMIAFDVPSPSEIDEDWLLTHDWIIRKALLDPKLGVALDYIRGGLTGDELSVEIFKAQWEVQTAVVTDLKDNREVHVRYRNLARQALQSSAELVADKFGLDDAVGVATGGAIMGAGGLLGPLGLMATTLIGGKQVQDSVTSDLTKDEIAAAQESARLGMEWANEDLQAAQQSYESAIHALEKATQDYVDAVRRRQEMRTRIDQLRIHVKENILYYMQAIWAHEPADQRYFRLYDKDIIWPTASGLPYARRSPLDTGPGGLAMSEAVENKLGPFDSLELKLPGPNPRDYDTRPLYEIADLDRLLGFKGNYAIFPLREGNAVTNYMAGQFLDDYFGVKDPDEAGQYPTQEEALETARCLWKRAGEDEGKRARVIEWLTDVLENQIFVSDEIVVPSGELFIEALPGSHPLLEDFKLRHRAVDMETATNQLRLNQIELLRRAMRLKEEDVSDPDVDRVIRVEGGSANINVDTE